MPLISVVHAQEAPVGGQAPPAPNPLMSFLPFIIIFFIFYFLMIRPQKKKLEEEKKLLSSLARGDEVFTKSGLIGKISHLTDNVITLEVEGAKLRFLRTQIGGLSRSLFKAHENKKEKKA